MRAAKSRTKWAVPGWGGKLASFGDDPAEALLVCSNVDGGLSLFDLGTGRELSHYKSCASPRHGLTCAGKSLFAASQVPKSATSASGAIFLWSWNKVQPELKSYPVEPIGPLACTGDGTYLVGGGSSGRIYLWEVATGKLLKVWAAHYKAVTCLVFSDDESLLISGADDGFVNVWTLLRVLDVSNELGGQGELQVPYLYTWSGHTLAITGLTCGYGGSSAVVVSSSLDTTCKIWSLGLGSLLRTIKFPGAINCVVLDPAEYALYAGSNDGRIFIAALNFGIPASAGGVGDGMITTLKGHSRAVTSLAFSIDGVSLFSGSEDCTVCMWDTFSRQTLKIYKHNKGPITNVLLITQPYFLQQSSTTDPHGFSMAKKSSIPLAAPLGKYMNTEAGQDLNMMTEPLVVLPSAYSMSDAVNGENGSSLITMQRQIKELEEQGSSAAMQLELEKSRCERQRAIHMVQQWQQVHQDLYYFCVEELMGGNNDEEEGEKDNEREKAMRKGRSKARDR